MAFSSMMNRAGRERPADAVEPRLAENDQLRAEIRFRAMGTDVHLIVVGSDAHAISSRSSDHVIDLERRWSRFLPNSEISRLNRAEGRSTIVSEPTFELLERAVDGWSLTEGRFDPFMEAAIVEAGYDRSFELLESTVHSPSRGSASTGARGVRLDPSHRLVRLPPGLRFDPGAIGKGLAADIVSRSAMADGAAGVLVNIGGDLRVRGRSPDDAGWVVAIREPSVSDQPIATVELREAALATSTVRRRRWSSPDGDQHHVLDPATGCPSDADADLVSVIAGQAWWAEVSATALLVTPPEASQRTEARIDDPHLLVRPDGRVERGGEFERWER